ncbi:MAG: polysaccharide deacetylase family protein [Clostridia bacterium]|nr:polysaccharide deacetylase family protein [Clostridia bacterium]
MYVIKMKTLIYYFAVFAVVVASIGIIRLYTSDDVALTASTPVENKEAMNDNSEVLSSAKKEKVEVPILMYHSILRSTNTHGNYIISESAFEADLKFLKDNGYTTIVMKDLIDYVYNDKALPKKPVVLTFDDGYFNNFSYAFPLLKKYNSKAVLSIIGYYTDLYTKTPDENPSYSHVTWNDVKKMMDSGLVEMQNHSHNLHTTDKGRNGAKKKQGESQAKYRELLMSDLGKLQEDFKTNTGYTPSTFTYPFGSVSNASFDIIKDMGFKASLSCESGMNTITRDPECLYMLKRYLRTPKKSAESILK